MRIFISPPFGSITPVVSALRSTLPNTVPILGSFTLKPRTGKILRAAKTLRYDFEKQGWRNSMGLMNPGLISGLDEYYSASENGTCVLSIALTDAEDARIAQRVVPRDVNIELNVSCPNAEVLGGNSDSRLKGFLDSRREICMVKLAHKTNVKTVKSWYDMGFSQFHCSNTDNGLSGLSLVENNLRVIEELDRSFCGNLEITGGGGIETKQIMDKYLWHGSENISISTVCFNPFKVARLLDEIQPGCLWRLIPKI